MTLFKTLKEISFFRNSDPPESARGSTPAKSLPEDNLKTKQLKQASFFKIMTAGCSTPDEPVLDKKSDNCKEKCYEEVYFSKL